MLKKTRGDQNRAWYKYISEEMIHPLFTLTTFAFAFELKIIEMIGVLVVTVGLQSAQSAVVTTQRNETTHQFYMNGNAARSAHKLE